MVLGDGYINVRKRLNKGIYKYDSSEMRIVHSLAQKDYCIHKAGLVKKYLGGNFSVREYASGPGGAYRCCGFSASNSYFKLIKKWLYPGGKKTITLHALEMLTDEGLALWYMDDGHARRNLNKDGYVSSVATSIATMCSKEEIDTIISWFKARYSVEWKPRYKKGSPEDKAWFIECNTENSRFFAHIVRPFIIDSMMYKLAHVADLTSHECRAPVGKCTTCNGPLYDKRRGGLCGTCYSRRYYRDVRRFIEGRKPNR